jgi:hypothetical protein
MIITAWKEMRETALVFQEAHAGAEIWQVILFCILL